MGIILDAAFMMLILILKIIDFFIYEKQIDDHFASISLRREWLQNLANALAWGQKVR